jgi:hypothetical protein
VIFSTGLKSSPIPVCKKNSEELNISTQEDQQTTSEPTSRCQEPITDSRVSIIYLSPDYSGGYPYINSSPTAELETSEAIKNRIQPSAEITSIGIIDKVRGSIKYICECLSKKVPIFKLNPLAKNKLFSKGVVKNWKLESSTMELIYDLTNNIQAIMYSDGTSFIYEKIIDEYSYVYSESNKSCKVTSKLDYETPHSTKEINRKIEMFKLLYGGFPDRYFLKNYIPFRADSNSANFINNYFEHSGYGIKGTVFCFNANMIQINFKRGIKLIFTNDGLMVNLIFKSEEFVSLNVVDLIYCYINDQAYMDIYDVFTIGECMFYFSEAVEMLNHYRNDYSSKFYLYIQ